MKRLWRNYSLSIVLAGLFLLSWILQTWTGWVEFAAEQREHGQSPSWAGSDGYVWAWASATLENWQSEFLQLLTFVVLTSFLIHKGSHESKDTDEEMQQALARIEKRLGSDRRREPGRRRRNGPRRWREGARARRTPEPQPEAPRPPEEPPRSTRT